MWLAASEQYSAVNYSAHLTEHYTPTGNDAINFLWTTGPPHYKGRIQITFYSVL